MGPSGSGTSTLLHLLGGLDTPTAGSVELECRDLAGMDDRQRTLLRRDRVGEVFQFFNLVAFVLSAPVSVATSRLLTSSFAASLGFDLERVLPVGLVAVVAVIALAVAVDRLRTDSIPATTMDDAFPIITRVHG